MLVEVFKFSSRFAARVSREPLGRIAFIHYPESLRQMTANRIAGAVLISIGLVGFLTVADDLRHVGETVGVSAIVLAGIILIASTVKPIPISPVLARSCAFGIFSGMVLGAGLDNMLVGVALGLAAGTLAGLLIGRHHRSAENKAP